MKKIEVIKRSLSLMLVFTVTFASYTGLMTLAVFVVMQLSGCEPLADSEVSTTTDLGVTNPAFHEPPPELEPLRIDPNDWASLKSAPSNQDSKAASTDPEPDKPWSLQRSRILGLWILDPDFKPKLPDFKVTDIEKMPADNPARATEYDYFVHYELPNGKTRGVIIHRDPLTPDLIHEAIEEDLRSQMWYYHFGHPK